MKLHLPKKLLSCLLSAMTIVAAASLGSANAQGHSVDWSGSATNWADASAWFEHDTLTAIAFAPNDSVYFGKNYTTAQTINLEDVKAISGLNITGTANHVFQGAGSLSMAGGVIRITNTGTTTFNLSNVGLTNVTTHVEGGNLILSQVSALGSGKVYVKDGTLKGDAIGALNNTEIHLDHSVLTSLNNKGASLGEAGKAGTIYANNGSEIVLEASAAINNNLVLADGTKLTAINPGNSNTLAGQLTFQGALSVSGSLYISGNVVSSVNEQIVFQGGASSAARKELKINGNNAACVSGLQTKIELGAHSVLFVDGLNTAINLSGGAITMKNDSWIWLNSSNSGANRSISKTIILDTAADQYAGFGGASNGNFAKLNSHITGTGNFAIESMSNRQNTITLQNGWANNDYVGKTKLAYSGAVIYELTIGVANGTVLTPFGLYDEALGHGIASIESSASYTINAGNTTAAGISLGNGLHVKANTGNVTLSGFGREGSILGSVTIDADKTLNLKNGTNVAGSTINLAGALLGSGNIVATNTTETATSYLKLSGNTSAYTGTITIGSGMSGIALNSDKTIGGNILATGKMLRLDAISTVQGTSAFSNLYLDSSLLSQDNTVLTTHGATTLSDAGGAIYLLVNNTNLLGEYALWNYAGGITGAGFTTASITVGGIGSVLYDFTLRNDTTESTYYINADFKDNVLVWDKG